jgi:hypothetical protein
MPRTTHQEGHTMQRVIEFTIARPGCTPSGAVEFMQADSAAVSVRKFWALGFGVTPTNDAAVDLLDTMAQEDEIAEALRTVQAAAALDPTVAHVVRDDAGRELASWTPAPREPLHGDDLPVPDDEPAVPMAGDRW